MIVSYTDTADQALRIRPIESKSDGIQNTRATFPPSGPFTDGIVPLHFHTGAILHVRELNNMDGFLERYATYFYAIMRIVSGFLFIWHGTQKLLGYPPHKPAPGAAPSEGLSAMVAVAGTIELVGGFLIMIGLFTTVAAFLSSGLMAFAYFIGHFTIQAFLPIENRGELAVLYCFVFLYIASRGSGVWSVDGAFKGSSSLTSGG